MTIPWALYMMGSVLIAGGVGLVSRAGFSASLLVLGLSMLIAAGIIVLHRDMS